MSSLQDEAKNELLKKLKGTDVRSKANVGKLAVEQAQAAAAAHNQSALQSASDSSASGKGPVAGPQLRREMVDFSNTKHCMYWFIIYCSLHLNNYCLITENFQFQLHLMLAHTNMMKVLGITTTPALVSILILTLSIIGMLKPINLCTGTRNVQHTSLLHLKGDKIAL